MFLILVGCGAGTPTPDREEERVADTAARFAAEAPPPQIHETRVRRSSIDAAGDVHVLLDAHRNGHRVLGAEMLRHVFADGSVRTRRFADTGAIPFDDTPATVSEAEAGGIARRAMADLKARVISAKPELLYERQDGSHRLVYSVDVEMEVRDTGDVEWRLWIDARTGAVIHRANVTRRTEGAGHSYYYGKVPLRAFYYPAIPADGFQGGFTLEDHLRPTPGTYISTGSYYDAHFNSTGPQAYFDDDDDWGNGMAIDPAKELDPKYGPMSVYGQTAATDAHHAAGWAWDFYVDVFKRNGPFGNGDPFDNVVNYPGSPAPFFMVASRKMYINIADQQCEPQAHLSVVAHEVGHGFFSTAAYVSIYAGETGGLDEANSDIVGKLTEIYGLNGMGLPPGVTTATLPATVTPGTPGLPLKWNDWALRGCYNHVMRWMNRPSKDGQSLDAASALIEATLLDPHYASGPINRMFFFLAQGVAKDPALGETSGYLPQGLPGIGIPAAADVYYRAVAGYLRYSDPKYADLRLAMEEAAGSNTKVLKAVQDAFAAVNIGPPADRTGPAITDVTNVTAPGRNMGATVADPSGVKRVDYRAEIPWGTATSAPWSILTPAGVPSGVHQVTVCATDQLDNRACVQHGVIVDADPPAISLFEVTNPYVAANKTVHLVATDRAILLVNIVLDGTQVLHNRRFKLGTVPGIDFTTTLALPLNSKGVPALTQGSHTLEAQVFDSAGNMGSKTATFLWDTKLPDDCHIITSQSGYPQSGTLDAVANDASSGIATVAFTLDGAALKTVSLNDPPNAHRFVSVSWNKVPGTYQLGVTCTDRFGWTASSSIPLVIVYPPTASITGKGQVATPTRAIIFSLYATDLNGIKGVSSGVDCSSSGRHPVDTSFAGYPTVYQKMFTVGGLVLGESCRIFMSAADPWDITTWAPPVTFIVQDPAPPPPVYTCNSDVHSGSNSPATFTIDVGKTSGTFDFNRNTYEVPDAMVISCAGTGTINGSPSVTAGCESTSNEWATSPLSFSCSSSQIKVSVTPNCAGLANTLWDFSLGCAI
jgi:Zn-dependent metalloprotease